jgi:hypothetical protein
MQSCCRFGRHHALRRFWKSARGFWHGPTARLAWGLIALLIGVTVLQLLVQYRLICGIAISSTRSSSAMPANLAPDQTAVAVRSRQHRACRDGRLGAHDLPAVVAGEGQPAP